MMGFSGRILPEHGINSTLVGFVNEYDKVMTQNPTQSLVNHRYIGVGAETVTELVIHHQNDPLPSIEEVVDLLDRSASIAA
jgi:hypothetical protein